MAFVSLHEDDFTRPLPLSVPFVGEPEQRCESSFVPACRCVVINNTLSIKLASSRFILIQKSEPTYESKVSRAVP